MMILTRCSKFYKLGGCTEIKRIFYNMRHWKSLFSARCCEQSNHLFYFDFHVCSAFYIFKSQITENAFSLLWRTEKQDFLESWREQHLTPALMMIAMP